MKSWVMDKGIGMVAEGVRGSGAVWQEAAARRVCPGRQLKALQGAYSGRHRF